MTPPTIDVPAAELARDFAAVFERLGSAGELVWARVDDARFLLVNGADHVREVLIERAGELAKPPSQTIDLWRPSVGGTAPALPVAPFRAALAKGLGAGRVAAALAAVDEAVAAETADWRDGLELPLMPTLRRIAVRWACTGAFGSRLSEREVEQAAAVMRWFDREPRVRLPRRLPTGHRLRRPFALARLGALAERLIANADLSEPTELSAVVSDLPRLAPELGPDRRRSLVAELLLGAAGPLTQTSGWLLLRFASHADAAAALRREWDEALDAGTAVDPHSLRRLRLTEAFVREVTRFHPTNDRITRVAVADTTVGGEAVPAGTRVIVNVPRLHRDPALFEAPDAFRPERWLDGRPSPHKFAYVAFGAGSRRCLGEQLGLVSLVALLPALVRSRDLVFAAARASETGRRQLTDDLTVTLRAIPSS